MPTRPTPQKTLGVVSNHFPILQNFTFFVITSCWSIRHDSTGRELSEACAWLPVDLTYPYSVINHNTEYGYLRSPVSPSSESLNPGVGLGPPNTLLR